MSEIAERIAGNGNAALVRLGIAVSSGVSLLLVSIISWNASGALKKLDDTHDKVIQIQTQFDGQVQLYTELRATRDHEISDLHLTQQSITREREGRACTRPSHFGFIQVAGWPTKWKA